MTETAEFSRAWPLLENELNLWANAGRQASFWWRDDDAVTETPELNKLDSLCQTFKVPVSIAVIPASVKPNLELFLRGKEHFCVLQHGFSHQSYAAKGQKKIEIGGERRLEEIIAELTIGYDKLKKLFPGQFVPAIVPPWNRIDSKTYDILLECNLKGISTVRARLKSHLIPGLLQVNTHLDPINWRHGRGFIGSSLAIALLHQHLYLRRTTNRCRHEPTGLLTHHLDQNEAVWNFCRSLFARLSRHPAVNWLSARQIWNEEVT